MCCCCYRKGTNFQANHNKSGSNNQVGEVVVATAKVQIFKQITTKRGDWSNRIRLLLLPQRYKFSSKSQLGDDRGIRLCVVVATAKVQIFKQITTAGRRLRRTEGCCCYRKGTNFQANHNIFCHIIFQVWLLLLPQRYKFSSKSQLYVKWSCF